jgi:hypothetical protein
MKMQESKDNEDEYDYVEEDEEEEEWKSNQTENYKSDFCLVFIWYLRNQGNGLSVYTEFIQREYTHITISIRNNTSQIQMTQMHAYTLITHEDGSIHHSWNYNDIL